MPGGFGVNDVMGVGRRSRAVDLSDAQRRAVEQMALQQREQAMFEQAGLGRASDPAPNRLGQAWDWVREAQIPQIPGLPGPESRYLPPEMNPNAWVQALNAGKRMAEPLMPSDVGYSGYGADTPLPGLPKALGGMFGAGKYGLRALGLADEAVPAAQAIGKSNRPVIKMNQGDDLVDDVADLVQPTLPGTSAAEMQYAVSKAGLDTARGSLRWTPELGVPRAGKPGLGGSGAPAADARPLFRTERPAGSTIWDDPTYSGPPAGSNYYSNADGTISRFKTQNTASQSIEKKAKDQWGWMDPAEYRYVNEEAAAAIRRQMEANAPTTVKWEWNAAGDQLQLVDIATGKSIGAVYDAPRVGLQPFASWPDGRTHLGDRIAEVFQPRGRHRR